MKRTPLKRKTPLRRGPWKRTMSKRDGELRNKLLDGDWSVVTPPMKRWRRKPKPKQPTVLQRRTWLNRESEKHKIDRQIYNILRPQFLKDNPWCQLMVTCGASAIRRNIRGVTQIEMVRRATQIHHTHGRGKFYLAVETWKGSCAECHRWENDHRNQAVQLGLRVRVRKYERSDRIG